MAQSRGCGVKRLVHALDNSLQPPGKLTKMSAYDVYKSTGKSTGDDRAHLTRETY